MPRTTELRHQRESLFEQWINAESLEDWLSIQEQIAESIRASERELRGSDNGDALRFHISRLRLYADGLAWLSLHPHTIRQMAKNPGSTPSIEDQGKAFDQVIESARRSLKKYRAPVLICDISNVLRIGDLVICVNPEVPIVVECKIKFPKPQHLMQGRIGRQVSRVKGLMRYLHKGSAKVFGENSHRQTVESAHRAQRNWEVLAEICHEARRTGRARSDMSEFEVLWAYTPDYLDSVLAEVREYEDRTAYFGTSNGLMNMTDGLFPPPIVWPIPSELRFLLLEGDIQIAHLVDVKAFERDFGQGEGIEMSSTEQFPVHVKVGGNVYPLSLRFVYDVLYGFETIDSCVNGLIDFARQLKVTQPVETEDTQAGKPPLHHVDSLEAATSLLNSGIDSMDTLVSMPLSLLELLCQKPEKLRDHPDVVPLPNYDSPPAYAILDWGTFRELMVKHVQT